MSYMLTFHQLLKKASQPIPKTAVRFSFADFNLSYSGIVYVIIVNMIKKLILLLGLLAVNSASAVEKGRFEMSSINGSFNWSYLVDKKNGIICYSVQKIHNQGGIAVSCVSLDKGVNK